MRLFPLFPAGIIAAALLAAGCATPTSAIQQRTRLATLAEMQAQQAAAEVDQMATKLVLDERARVEANKLAEYNKGMAQVSTPEEGATLGYNLANDMAAIDASAKAEAQRLGQIGAKVRATGEAARVLNQMADAENDLNKVTADLVFDEVLPAAIQIAEQVQTHLAAQEAARAAKLAAEAEASKRDAEAKPTEEHHEPPAETPATPPAVTTGS